MPVSFLNRAWLRTFLPAAATVDRFERMRSCAGAMFGVALTGAISYFVVDGDVTATAWLVAPMGASAVLLFAVPASPLAQPWSVLGGNLSAALIGVTCAKLFGTPLVAAAFAIGLAIGAMFILRCIHPPSGAVALTMVLGGPAVLEAGYSFVLAPVMLNSVLIALLAVFYNNAIGRRYPHSPQMVPPAPPPKAAEAPLKTTLGISAADLDTVLKSYNQVIDISREDLENIFIQVEALAYRRRFGELACKDIMRTDIIAVDFGTELEEAWRILHTHKLKALPVLDRGRRLIGIVTPIDFMEHAGVETFVGFKGKLRHFLSRSQQSHSDKPEVVGQIMTTKVYMAQDTQPVIELLPLISEHGLRHIPVIDDERRLVGMLTQADMVNALYGQKMLNG
jgi:CBS domain-containing membrane protein